MYVMQQLDLQHHLKYDGTRNLQMFKLNCTSLIHFKTYHENNVIFYFYGSQCRRH